MLKSLLIKILKLSKYGINSKLINLFLSARFKSFVKINNLIISDQENNVQFELQFKGESKQINFGFRGILLYNKSKQYYIKISTINIDCEWIDALVCSLLKKGRGTEIDKDIYDTIERLFH